MINLFGFLVFFCENEKEGTMVFVVELKKRFSTGYTGQ